MHDILEPSEATRPALEVLTERMRLHRECNTMPAPIVVEDVVTAVLDTLDGRLTLLESKLLQEIGGLGRIIEQAKSDIASISLDAIRDSHLPCATGELGAIVEHTAMATNIILESCETLDVMAGTLNSDQANTLRNATMQIYEACGFQDITGQRITKVVKALQAIEAKVLELAGIPAEQQASRSRLADSEVDTEALVLLNGPMLPHEAMGQDDIDKLLGDFG